MWQGVGLAVALAACGTEVGELESSGVGSELTSANKLSANKLSANKLSANKLSANGLADSALSTPALVQTAEGREVLSYIISCALPVGSRIEFTVDAEVHTFAGEIGLAPDWAAHAPTISERRWVTACVLSRTNLFGTSVQISMRAAHQALEGSRVETTNYTLREGAFYGDLFEDDGPKMYACESPIEDSLIGLSTFDLRACTLSLDGVTTLCGMTYTGKCVTQDADGASCAHRQFPYTDCRTGTSSADMRWAEVITVSLANR